MSSPPVRTQSPPHKCKAPLLTTFWRRFCVNVGSSSKILDCAHLFDIWKHTLHGIGSERRMWRIQGRKFGAVALKWLSVSKTPPVKIKDNFLLFTFFFPYFGVLFSNLSLWKAGLNSPLDPGTTCFLLLLNTKFKPRCLWVCFPLSSMASLVLTANVTPFIAEWRITPIYSTCSANGIRTQINVQIMRLHQGDVPQSI